MSGRLRGGAVAHALVAGGALVALGLVAAPPAGAQVEALFPEPLTLLVEAFPGPIAPLQGPGFANFTVSLSCEAASKSMLEARRVDLTVAAHPEWAAVTVIPAAMAFSVEDPASCPPGSRIEQRGQLAAVTTSAAPAFVPGVALVEAALAGEDGSASANVSISARYFAILDVSVSEPIRVGPPGVTEEFALTVASFGNGETRVSFHVVDVEAGWNATLPEPFVLGARQLGSEDTTRAVVVTLTPPPSERYVNAPGILKVEVVGEHAGGLSAERDTSFITMLLTSKGTTGDSTPSTGALIEDLLSDVPLPASAAPLALVAAAVALAARRGARR